MSDFYCRSPPSTRYDGRKYSSRDLWKAKARLKFQMKIRSALYEQVLHASRFGYGRVLIPELRGHTDLDTTKLPLEAWTPSYDCEYFYRGRTDPIPSKWRPFLKQKTEQPSNAPKPTAAAVEATTSAASSSENASSAAPVASVVDLTQESEDDGTVLIRDDTIEVSEDDATQHSSGAAMDQSKGGTKNHAQDTIELSEDDTTQQREDDGTEQLKDDTEQHTQQCDQNTAHHSKKDSPPHRGAIKRNCDDVTSKMEKRARNTSPPYNPGNLDFYQSHNRRYVKRFSCVRIAPEQCNITRRFLIYKCDYCDKVFMLESQRNMMRAHVAGSLHNSASVYVAGTDDEGSLFILNVFHARLECFDTQQYFSRCRYCSFVSRCKMTVVLHTQHLHKKQHRIKLQGGRSHRRDHLPIPILPVCGRCTVKFDSPDKLSDHWKEKPNHHPIWRLGRYPSFVMICPENKCLFMASSFEDMQKHVSTAHNFKSTVSVTCEILPEWEEQTVPAIMQLSLKGVAARKRDAVREAQAEELKMLKSMPWQNGDQFSSVQARIKDLINLAKP